MANPLSSVRNLTLGFIVCLTLLPSLAVEQELPLDHRLNERVVRYLPEKRLAMMETTVFRPTPGSYPLLTLPRQDAGAPVCAARPLHRHGHRVRQARLCGDIADAPAANQPEPPRPRLRHDRQRLRPGRRRARSSCARVDWIDAGRIVVAGQSYGHGDAGVGTHARPGAS
jgi:hypothetical protein